VQWVYIKSSTICNGDGVFADRDFKKDEYIGRYTGLIIGDVNIESDVARILRLSDTSENNSIIELQGRDWHVYVDGKRSPWSTTLGTTEDTTLTDRVFPIMENSWPGMFAHVINSCEFGKAKDRGQNVIIRSDGTVQACQTIHQHDELLTMYGAKYWERKGH
jgi:hypothetical protein